jgi:hypothetical protein
MQKSDAIFGHRGPASGKIVTILKCMQNLLIMSHNPSIYPEWWKDEWGCSSNSKELPGNGERKQGVDLFGEKD